MAFEIARIFEHTFQYYRRSPLQELSLEGKLRRLSRLIRAHLPMTLQGIGMVIPLFATSYLSEGPEGKGTCQGGGTGAGNGGSGREVAG